MIVKKFNFYEFMVEALTRKIWSLAQDVSGDLQIRVAWHSYKEADISLKSYNLLIMQSFIVKCKSWLFVYFYQQGRIGLFSILA